MVAEAKEKCSWGSNERGLSAGRSSEKYESKFYVLYTLFIMTSLTPFTELLRCKELKLEGGKHAE
jgi:hypothetical protein